MPDREKVIKGLTACIDDMCDYCPYYDEEVPDCDYYGRCNRIEMNRDALALLREHEPVEPHVEHDSDDDSWYYGCGACHEAIDYKDRFCRHCGKAVKWDADGA